MRRVGSGWRAGAAQVGRAARGERGRLGTGAQAAGGAGGQVWHHRLAIQLRGAQRGRAGGKAGAGQRVDLPQARAGEGGRAGGKRVRGEAVDDGAGPPDQPAAPIDPEPRVHLGGGDFLRRQLAVVDDHIEHAAVVAVGPGPHRAIEPVDIDLTAGRAGVRHPAIRCNLRALDIEPLAKAGVPRQRNSKSLPSRVT